MSVPKVAMKRKRTHHLVCADSHKDQGNELQYLYTTFSSNEGDSSSVNNENPSVKKPTMQMLLEQTRKEENDRKRKEREIMKAVDAEERCALGGHDAKYLCLPAAEFQKILDKGPPSIFTKERWDDVKSEEE
jgi:hypothetical protein